MIRLAAALVLCLAAGPALAQSTPQAADILFETPHLRTSPPGTVLTYRYQRSSTIEPFGPPIDDRIRLTLETGDSGDTRTVAVQMFTAERRRAAGPFDNASTNPVLMLFLEHGLEDLSRVLGANPRYLKTAIRVALRDEAKVTPTEIARGGSQVTGWRIAIRPFAGDAHADRMRGLETLEYVFVTADAVPGTLVSITAAAEAPGGTLLQESLTYEPSSD